MISIFFLELAYIILFKFKLCEIDQGRLGGRPNPTSKHSTWVHKRRVLEEHKKGNVKEVTVVFLLTIYI